MDLSRDLRERKPVRLRESALWCRRAAELGDPWAQGWLGHCHDQGIGVRRDGARAMFWWRRALRSFDSMRARVSRSPAYRRASIEDRRSFLEECRRKASIVMWNIGSNHLGGDGLKRNRHQAVRWLRRAAELGHRASTIRLSDLLIYEDLDLGPRETMRWIRRAAEAGDADAQVALGVRLFRGDGVRRGRSEALLWYRRAAGQGDFDAWYNLGQAYHFGDGVPKSWPRALACYRRAASENCTALYWIFSYYAGEEGAPRNPRSESIWLRRVVAAAKKGAARGDDEGLFILGILHANGQGVEKNWRRAAQLYRRAALLGNSRAAFCLGLCYRDGDGVRRDRRSARAWFERAARLGEPDAPRELARDGIEIDSSHAPIEQGGQGHGG